MANLWTYEQKFNDLTNGNLGGQDSWVDNGGTLNVVTTGTPYEGTKHIVNVDGVSYKRNLPSAIVSGTFYISGKAMSLVGGGMLVLINQASGQSVRLGFRDGILVAGYEDSSWVSLLDPYVVDTDYRIGIAFECGAGGWAGLSADHVKFNLNGGAWGSEIAFEVSATTIDAIQFYRFNGSYLTYWDFISPDYSSTEIKSVNGLAYASIKSINGLAIASIKNFNGLA